MQDQDAAVNQSASDQILKTLSLETERLKLAHISLQEHFKDVQSHLQETNTKLYAKIAELDSSKYYLEAILSNITQGILFIDLNGMVTAYNPAAEKILGKASQEVLYHAFWDIFSDDAFGFSFKQTLQSKKTPQAAFIDWTGKNGVKVELEVEVTFVETNGSLCAVAGQSTTQAPIQGVLILLRNVTEFRRLQIAANRADRLKELGEMAARVAHEIRNPLGGIRGFASLLQQDLKDRPELEQMAGQIVEATDGLNQIVTQVLNYTRSLQPHYESLDLVPFMGEIIQLIRADRAFSPNIDCQFETNVESLTVPADAQMLKSAFLNLLVNGLQAMPEGGILKITLSQQNDAAVIVISDTGVGIAEENLDKIFSPFFTTKEKGNGLGLAEVQKVILAHGGSIEVISLTGNGTVFTIKIPNGV